MFDKCSSEQILTHHFERERERDHHVVWDLKAFQVITMQRGIHQFICAIMPHSHAQTYYNVVKCGLHMESTRLQQQRGARGPQL